MIGSIIQIICSIEMLCGFKPKANAIVICVLNGLASVLAIVLAFIDSPIYLWNLPFTGAIAVSGLLLNEVRDTYLPKWWIYVSLAWGIITLIV